MSCCCRPSTLPARPSKPSPAQPSASACPARPRPSTQPNSPRPPAAPQGETLVADEPGEGVSEESLALAEEAVAQQAAVVRDLKEQQGRGTPVGAPPTPPPPPRAFAASCRRQPGGKLHGPRLSSRWG